MNRDKIFIGFILCITLSHKNINRNNKGSEF